LSAVIIIMDAGRPGVELAAKIRNCTRTFASYGLDHLKPERDVRITILEAAPRILPPLPEKIAEAATGLLGTLAVTVITGERVTEVDAESVRTASGDVLHADLVVLAAGIQAPPVLANLD